MVNCGICSRMCFRTMKHNLCCICMEKNFYFVYVVLCEFCGKMGIAEPIFHGNFPKRLWHDE
jgi:hypothetical protein